MVAFHGTDDIYEPREQPNFDNSGTVSLTLIVGAFFFSLSASSGQQSRAPRNSGTGFSGALGSPNTGKSGQELTRGRTLNVIRVGEPGRPKYRMEHP